MPVERNFGARSSAGAACGPELRWPARGCSWSPAERSSPPPTRSSTTASRQPPSPTQTNINKRFLPTCKSGEAKRHAHGRPGWPSANKPSPEQPNSAPPCNERTTFMSCSCGPWSVSASPPSWPACLGWAIGRRILVPLHKVTGAARRASQEHLDERIGLDGPHDELKELADTFDDMLDRLDLAFASQRRFVANASHELRTPLTSMRTLIDVAMAKPTRTTEGLETVLGRVREALDQSEAIIDGLLTLARSDRGLTTRELVDLEAAAQDAIDQTSTAARASDIVIEADLSRRSHPRRSGPCRAPRRQPRGQRRPLQHRPAARYKSRPAPTTASPTSRSPIPGRWSPSRRWHLCSNRSPASINESPTAKASGSDCPSSPRS